MKPQPFALKVLNVVSILLFLAALGMVLRALPLILFTRLLEVVDC